MRTGVESVGTPVAPMAEPQPSLLQCCMMLVIISAKIRSVRLLVLLPKAVLGLDLGPDLPPKGGFHVVGAFEPVPV